MEFIEAETLPEAYHTALLLLRRNGIIVDCPDWNTRRKEVGMAFTVRKPLKEPMISKFFIGGPRELQQYKMEVCDGILDFMIGKGENVWEYTYHSRIAPQIPFVINELKRSPTSTRAVVDVRNTEIDSRNEHPACLQHMQFMIRNDALDLIVLMRSNDAPEATFMNAFAFISLQDKIAKELNVPVGTYTHIANSFHAYEKDWELLDNYCKKLNENFKGEWKEVLWKDAYSYNAEWQPLMAAYASDIMESTVKPLKEKYNC